LAVIASDDVWAFLAWHPKLARRQGTTATDGIVLHAGITDADAPPAHAADAWQAYADGVVTRMNAAAWPDAQLVLPAPFDEERRRLTEKLAKRDAQLQEAKARAEKFKARCEAARIRKPNWLSRTLGRFASKGTGGSAPQA
jgi:hypothetical protein